jgi:hypothetical protein
VSASRETLEVRKPCTDAGASRLGAIETQRTPFVEHADEAAGDAEALRVRAAASEHDGPEDSVRALERRRLAHGRERSDVEPVRSLDQRSDRPIEAFGGCEATEHLADVGAVARGALRSAYVGEWRIRGLGRSRLAGASEEEKRRHVGSDARHSVLK